MTGSDAIDDRGPKPHDGNRGGEEMLRCGGTGAPRRLDNARDTPSRSVCGFGVEEKRRGRRTTRASSVISCEHNVMINGTIMYGIYNDGAANAVPDVSLGRKMSFLRFGFRVECLGFSRTARA